MGFFDNAQDMLGRGAVAAQGVLDKGVSAAKGAVSGVAVEQQLFMKELVRLCADGWDSGWHQGCDGAASVLLDEAEVASCRPFFYDNPSSWVSIGAADEALAGAFIAATGQRTCMRDVDLDPARNVGIVEVSQAGDAWRIVWGFKDGGVPAPTFPQHFAAHAGKRAVYSCVPGNLASLRLLVPFDDRSVTSALWSALPACMAAAPSGVAALDACIPGPEQVASALRLRSAALTPTGALICAAVSCGQAYALAAAIDKAAGAYLRARAANGGSAGLPQAPGAEGLRAYAQARGLAIDEALLP